MGNIDLTPRHYSITPTLHYSPSLGLTALPAGSHRMARELLHHYRATLRFRFEVASLDQLQVELVSGN
jgi:hypothetical protein